MKSVFEKITHLLNASNVAFKHVQHTPTYTSEESAKARNEPLEIGAKALLVKIDDNFALFVMSAARKLDSKKVKALTQARSIRFADAEELHASTSLVPGSVPPFGQPILPFTLYVDDSITAQPRIAFNAGSLTDSIILETEDYLRLSQGILASFSK